MKKVADSREKRPLGLKQGRQSRSRRQRILEKIALTHRAKRVKVTLPERA